MHLLFISGTTIGGSGRSQRELAGQMVKLGHEVIFLVDPSTTARSIRWTYEQFADVSVKYGDRPGAGLVRMLEGLPGRRTNRTRFDDIAHFTSPIPENAAARVIEHFKPDVVVGSSILRLAWRKIRSMCDGRAIPTVLYVREEEALNHFSSGESPADAIVANAESLQSEIERQGFECVFIPSVIETSVTRTTSTRRVALAINPIESRGVSTIWQIAERLDHIPFVIQESWPLEPDQLSSVEENVLRLPNVEFRRTTPPGPGLYGDAKVLLVPYRVDNRPRVIAEAQANGIPVIAGDVPALVEAIGSGGCSVPLDDIGAWCDAIEAMWSDDDAYRGLADAASAHSKRAEINPEAVARQFEQIVLGLTCR